MTTELLCRVRAADDLIRRGTAELLATIPDANTPTDAEAIWQTAVKLVRALDAASICAANRHAILQTLETQELYR